MKKSVKTALALLGLTGVVTIGFLAGQHSIADEKKVYIPGDYMRSEIVNSVKHNPETGEEDIIENELPTVDQMKRLTNVSIYNVSSLEGIQYAENLESMSYSPGSDTQEIVDFRPISKLSNLKTFNNYAMGEATKYTPFDLSPFGALTNLESLDIGYFASIFDFTPLNNLENIRWFSSAGHGEVELPAIYVDRTTKQLVMSHPVKYSNQFDGERSVEGIIQSSDDPNLYEEADITLDGQKITIRNIAEGATSIDLGFMARSSGDHDYNFQAYTTCKLPIIWL